MSGMTSRMPWATWMIRSAGVVAGSMLAFFSLYSLLDHVITTEGERHAARLDQLESDVFDLRLPGAKPLGELEEDDCSSQTVGRVQELRFHGAEEEAVGFYRERLADRGWVEQQPAYEEDEAADFRKRFSWGYGFASVAIRARSVTVEIAFNC